MLKKSFHLVLPAFAVAALTFLLAGPAIAAEPEPWGINFQPPVTPVAERLFDFHNMLLYIITAIVIFVTGLLLYVMVRFNKKANPEPAKFSHNVPLEIAWTLIPCLILFFIMAPSLKLLFYMDRVNEPEMTLKVTGYQWYWGYEYPDHHGINFMSYMIPDEEIDESKDQIRLLSVDEPAVVPVDTDIQVLVEAGDVLHAFAMPAFGVKIDAVPGQTNETWMRITKPGTYYGQCSELCGKGHAYMPIEIRAVPKDEFARWVEDMKDEYGG